MTSQIMNIPFKDAQVKFAWKAYQAGLASYDEFIHALHTLEKDRAIFLQEQGMSEAEARDMAIDDIYALDHLNMDYAMSVVPF